MRISCLDVAVELVMVLPDIAVAEVDPLVGAGLVVRR